MAAAKAGRGSKKVHTLVALSKLHTRNRLSEINSGSKATAGGTEGVGVGVGVLVGANTGSHTVNSVTAVTPPALAMMVVSPAAKPGTRIKTLKPPALSVKRAGEGMIGRAPMVMEVRGAKGGKLVPDTAMTAPGEPTAGTSARVAEGTV